MTNTERKEMLVALFSPYLYGNLETEYCDDKFIAMQKERFGYDADNFSGKRFIDSDQHRVILETPDSHTSTGPDDVAMAIHGSTRPAEAAVAGLRGSGLIVARYSIFFGGPSGYSGNLPERTGYAIDIPKDISAVQALFSNGEFLDAILAREEGPIRSSLEKLSSGLERPVIATPYLSEVLRFTK